MDTGNFVISLDFEINWGVHDAIPLEDYKENLLGVRKVIPGLLDLFAKYNINATFATVGFLFFDNKNDLLRAMPQLKPTYKNERLSPYGPHLETVGENEIADPYHFAYSLIQKIKESGQEIGCHTFSHYYCLEEGQCRKEFKEDHSAGKLHCPEKWALN